MKIINSEIFDEKCYVINHFSGLDIYVIPKKLTTTYALIGTKFGSLDINFKREDKECVTTLPYGTAHYLEHKLFENSDGEDTFEKFAKYGAAANAYTSFSETRYLFSCSQNFEKCLEILLEFVTNPYFTEENVEKERGIIRQEINMYKDNPTNKLFYTMLRLMYEDHPIRCEISGTVKSIGNITKQTLYTAYDSFYRLSNMALCISGDVDPKTVEEIADRMLQPAEDIKVERILRKQESRVFGKKETIYVQVSEPMFYMGIKDVNISQNPKERMRKSIIMDLACECMFSVTNPFARRLYEDGIVTSHLSYDSDHTEQFSFFTLCASCDDPESVYEMICDHIENTKKEGIDQKIFEIKKRAAFGALVSEFDSTEDIANNFMDDIFEGVTTFEYAETIRDIKAAEVDLAIKEMFQKDYYCLAIARPADNEEIQGDADE